MNQALEESFCQIYCCAPHNIPAVDLSQSTYSEKRPPNLNKTKGIPPIFKEQQNAQTSLEKNKISKPFHSNDIDKQIRTRRDTYDISNEANVDNDLPGKLDFCLTPCISVINFLLLKKKFGLSFEPWELYIIIIIFALYFSDDQQISVTIQGRNFSTILTQNYLNREYNSYNFSYSVPISKYMPDDFVNIIFR